METDKQEGRTDKKEKLEKDRKRNTEETDNSKRMRERGERMADKNASCGTSNSFREVAGWACKYYEYVEIDPSNSVTSIRKYIASRVDLFAINKRKKWRV